MKKTIVTLFAAVLMASISNAQLSIGGGIGMMDTSGIAVQLKIQYEGKHAGIMGGFIAAPSPSQPCLFNLELFAPIRISDSRRFVPHGGYAYRLVSNDNKSLNGNEWIAGLSFEFGVMNMAAVYIDASYTQRKTVMFLIGIRGIFGEYKGCD